MVYDPATDTAENLGMPMPLDEQQIAAGKKEGQGVIDVTADEPRGLIYVITCEEQHWMLYDMKTKKYRELGPILRDQPNTLIDAQGRGTAITADFKIARYDPATDKVTVDPLLVEGKPFGEYLGAKRVHPDWRITPDGKTAYLQLLNDLRMFRVDLTGAAGQPVVATNLGNRIEGEHPDSRGSICIGPDGRVYSAVRIDNKTGFGTGYLHHLVRHDPGDGAMDDLGVLAVKNPDFFNFAAGPHEEPRRQRASDPRLSHAARRHAHAAARDHGHDRHPRRHDLRHDDLSLHAAEGRNRQGHPVKQPQITLLWIGNAQRELAAAKASVAGLPGVSVVDAIDVAAARSWLGEQPCAPELIVITQARPGEVGHEQVDHLRRAAPLARLVAVLGSWCEGETRSGRPWPAIERVYWHQWHSWLASELQQYGRHDSGWTLPITATPEERLLAAAVCHATDSAGRVVGIFSARRESAQMLVDACGGFGLEAIALDGSPERVSGLSLAIWDADRCHEAETDQLRRLAAAVRPAPLVALLTCPRLEEYERALAAGASAVFSKPLSVGQVFSLSRPS